MPPVAGEAGPGSVLRHCPLSPGLPPGLSVVSPIVPVTQMIEDLALAVAASHNEWARQVGFVPLDEAPCQARQFGE